jgi:CheY-like chemotaxis protein
MSSTHNHKFSINTLSKKQGLIYPGMDGFELIAKAKALRPSIHILLMTAAASKEVYKRAQSEGIDALMEKPLVLDQLMAFLDSIAFSERQWKTGVR